MPNLSEQFADDLIPHTVDLMRYSESVRERALVVLSDLSDDLVRQLAEKIPDDAVESVRLQRTRTLQTAVRRTTDKAYGKIDRVTERELIELAQEESSFVKNLSKRVIGVDLLSAGLSASRLKAVATSALIEGSPAADWWAKQSRDLQQRFVGQVRVGILAGETTPQIVRRVRGQRVGWRQVVVGGKKKRLGVFSGGVLNASNREATALVRTAVHQVSNDSMMETYRANSDVIKGVQALVTLDGRTSRICISRSGGAWDLEGNPLEESEVQESFPGSPPWHFNCRTVLIPITKTFNEILGRKDLPEIPKGTRASMDGQVAADLTYEGWLKTKPAAFQREVLGPGRYNLWKEGDISLNQLIDPTGRSLTLAELRKRAG